MANEMMFKRNGRAYKLVESKNEIYCGLCCFYHPNKEEMCDVFSESEMDCIDCGYIDRYFRETILSKLLYPFRAFIVAVIDVFYFSATGQGRT